MKLLILSDIHYPVGRLTKVREIIKKVRPDSIALLGDNIETGNDGPALPLYKEFVRKMNSIFPTNRTILLLGDGDFRFQNDSESVLKYVDSLDTINSNHIICRKGNMLFFHGNIERSKAAEHIGKGIVGASRTLGIQSIVPAIVSAIARLSLRANGDYLFMGHLHLLKKIAKERTTFCGTLNTERRHFGSESLGYVVVKHDNFRIRSERDIRAVQIKG